MKRFREWLYRRLSIAAKETLLKERKALIDRVEELRQENGRLYAYIDGLETAMRAQRRITINNGVDK